MIDDKAQTLLADLEDDADDMLLAAFRRGEMEGVKQGREQLAQELASASIPHSSIEQPFLPARFNVALSPAAKILFDTAPGSVDMRVSVIVKGKGASKDLHCQIYSLKPIEADELRMVIDRAVSQIVMVKKREEERRKTIGLG